MHHGEEVEEGQEEEQEEEVVHPDGCSGRGITRPGAPLVLARTAIVACMPPSTEILAAQVRLDRIATEP
jgi:hypothetical protein